MSKFIDSVQQLRLDRHRVPPNERISFAFGALQPVPYRTQNEYAMRVTWQSNFWCEDKAIHFCAENALRALRHDIYGDLKALHIELTQAAFAGDIEKIDEIIRKIWQEIEGRH